MMTCIEESKLKLCRAIERAAMRRQLTQRMTAYRGKTSQATISRIANKRIDQLTFNQLFRILDEISRFELMIALP